MNHLIFTFHLCWNEPHPHHSAVYTGTLVYCYAVWFFSFWHTVPNNFFSGFHLCILVSCLLWLPNVHRCKMLLLPISLNLVGIIRQCSTILSFPTGVHMNCHMNTVHEKNKNQQGLHSTYLNHPYVFKCFQTNDCNCTLQHFQVLQTSFFCFPYLVQ